MGSLTTRLVGPIALLAVAADLVLAAPPVGASAADLTCGDTVTTSTSLTADVGPCSGDGLIVGADNITLDLAGHTISGPNTDTAQTADDVGVRVRGHTGVTVRGGTVNGFAAGVAVQGGSANTVTHMVLRDNIGFQDESGNFGDGIAVLNSSHNTISFNQVRHNGPYEGIGVFGNDVPDATNTSSGNHIDHNVVLNNDIIHLIQFLPPDQQTNSDDSGINLGFLVGGSQNNFVTNNLVALNGFHGILACSAKGVPCLSTDNVITGNLVHHNATRSFFAGDGIHVLAGLPGLITPACQNGSVACTPARDRIEGNVVTDTPHDGIRVANSDNQILNNTALRNGTQQPNQWADLSGFCRENTVINPSAFPNEPPFTAIHTNVWHGNRYMTSHVVDFIDGQVVSDNCLDSSNQQIGGGSSPAPASASGVAASNGQTSRAEDNDDGGTTFAGGQFRHRFSSAQ